MISIIIPTYNDSEHLVKTIASCLVQDIQPEIIVVDDCSTKLYLPEIDEFIHIAINEYIINSKNIGLAESRDIGIEKATNDFILPLDTGDWLYPNVLGKMLKEIQDVDIVYGNMTQESHGEIFQPPGKDGITRDGMLKMNQLWCSSMFRKSLWKEVGGYRNGLHTSYEDYHYFNKCLMAGAKFKYIDLLIYNHTYNSDSMLSKLHKNTDYYNNLARRPLYEE